MSSGFSAHKRLAEAGLDAIYDQLTGETSFTDLSFLLVGVFAEHAKKQSPSDLLNEFKRQSIVQACDIKQSSFLELDQLLFELIASSFEPVEFPPVSPLGTTSSIACSSQNKILSTIRKMEVSGDIGTVLALECARRRQAAVSSGRIGSPPVALCSSHRALRLQNYSLKGHSQHFRIFSLASSAKSSDGRGFEVYSMLQQLIVYVQFLERLTQMGFDLQDVQVKVSDISLVEKLVANLDLDRTEIVNNTRKAGYSFFQDKGIRLPEYVEDPNEIDPALVAQYGIRRAVEAFKKVNTDVFGELKSRFPWAKYSFDLRRITGIGHYSGLSFRILARSEQTSELNLADGGATDWTEKLLNDRHERFFVSAIGTELLLRLFRGVNR